MISLSSAGLEHTNDFVAKADAMATNYIIRLFRMIMIFVATTEWYLIPESTLFAKSDFEFLTLAFCGDQEEQEAMPLLILVIHTRSMATAWCIR